MALTEFNQGAVICGEGEPLSRLSLIMKGSAEASLNGIPFRFEKGDVVGLCGLGSGKHCFSYTAVSDAAVIAYPCDGFEALETILRDNADVANLLVNAMCRQLAALLQCRAALKLEADETYELLREIYPQYERMCALYALTSKKLPGLTELVPFSKPDPVEDWVGDYYMEIKDLEPAARKNFFYKKPGITAGFLRRGAGDILSAYRSCQDYRAYMEEISKFFVDASGHDLFALVSDLHLSSIKIKGADAAVVTLMARLVKMISGMTGVNSAQYQERQRAYKAALIEKRGSQSQEVVGAPVVGAPRQNLSDSLDTILAYSGCPEELCNKFAKSIHDFTTLEDRGGSDDIARRLRKELTATFYKIYQNIFIKSIDDPALPTIIKMFINFGYVDEALAGHENADYLYSIADSVKGDPDRGVYTIREWLTAIYRGQKEPNRNEFDTDYGEYIHEKKVRGEIDAKEEANLLSDLEGKLRFEIENTFPIVNKITFGRISTFCPLFNEQNILRRLDASLVTSAALSEKLDEIRGVDFSAYSREILYSNTKSNISNEYLHPEVLPDFILTPVAGIRGAMWQEIEGRKRATPARMFVPIFLETDLKTLLIRLTGEFRWEMCKRIQGIRWNDVTNPSLTSIFSDYLQFYRNNKEISIEVKEDIKLGLIRAKNNYKNVFVAEYAEWLLYESNGSPRLNKVVLKFMLDYCPFPAAIREKLMQNPRYNNILTRYNNKQQQRAKHMSAVIQRVNQTVKETPQELLDELEFSQK